MTLSRLRSAAIALAALFLATGCPTPQGESGVLELDVGQYEAYVHPVFEGSCATLDCHGDEGRPLRLYSETGLRIRDDLRAPVGRPTIPITPEELAGNVQAIRAVDVERPIPETRFLVLKPLSNVEDGIHHYGGRIWTGTDDPAYRCVLSWLYHALDTDACAAAAARDGLPPI